MLLRLWDWKDLSDEVHWIWELFSQMEDLTTLFQLLLCFYELINQIKLMKELLYFYFFTEWAVLSESFSPLLSHPSS